LDRHVGAELLEYLLTGEPPVFDVQRIVNSTALLYDDLLRQGDARLQFGAPDNSGVAGNNSLKSKIIVLRRDGKNFVIVLSGPLTPDHPADPGIVRHYAEDETTIVIVNELLVRGNLPAATREVMSRVMA
jgi:hypothetical protein